MPSNGHELVSLKTRLRARTKRRYTMRAWQALKQENKQLHADLSSRVERAAQVSHHLSLDS